tara:strand:+ start:1763 stop:3070 length:1308 start_codon:yes stop_codon:yes gene_type:complete
MKKAILVAASLFTTAAAVTIGEPLKASPQFTVNSSSAGNITFQGTGTAQFNNSLGTNNSFQVGSSTNMGVNASTSSTPEYGVTSHAKLDLAGTSVLRQVIGTSGTSQQSTATQTAAMTHAHSVASSGAHDTAVTAASAVQAERSTQAASSFESSNGGSFSAYRESNASFANDTWTWNSDAEYKSESEYTSARDSYAASESKAAYEAEYDATYSTEYSSAYENAYTNSASQIQDQSSNDAMDGTIKGVFTTTESGSASTGGSMADWAAEAETSASSEVDRKWGVAYDQTRDYGAVDSEFSVSSEYEWSQARESDYSSSYASAYSTAASNSNRSSNSSVEVNGIGSDANIAAASTSTFDVQILNRLSGTDSANSTATANGSAGANLATSSFANQSQASTASAFMQAFGSASDASAMDTSITESIIDTNEDAGVLDPT